MTSNAQRCAMSGANMNIPSTGMIIGDITRLVPKTGPGVTAYHILRADLPHVPIMEVLNALHFACEQGKLTKLGSFYWRK